MPSLPNVAGRPRPVLVVATVLVGLQAAAAALEFTDTVSDRVFAWIIVAIAVLQAMLGLWTQGQVTPLSAPQDNEGRVLTPVPPIRP